MKITSEQIAKLEEKGWSIHDDSPLRLTHSATASSATGLAAILLVEHLTGLAPRTVTPMEELQLLHARVERLVAKGFAGDKANTDVWREVYDEVFSDNCSTRVWAVLKELDLSMDHYSPDMGYDDDVLAFSRALDRLMRRLAEENKLS